MLEFQLVNKSEEILVAASSLFARYSYAKVTMEQIATSLNMVPGALYHYFRDKEELIYSCYLRGLRIYEQEMEISQEPGMDGLEIIRRFIRGRLKPENQRMILFSDIDALPLHYSKTVHEQRWKNAEKLAGIIQQGVADGSLNSNDPMLTAISLISTLDWIFFWYSENDYYTRQYAIDAIDDIITHGVYRRDLPIPAWPDSPDLSPFLEKQASLGKREAKYDHMLCIAADNFNRKGAMGASLENIAKDAGISRAGIYYHFDDKEELLLACLQRGLDREIEIGAHVSSQGYGSTDDEIQRTRLLLMLHATPYGPKSTYHNINYLTTEHRENYVSSILESIAQDQKRYQASINKGKFRNVDIYFAQRVISGMNHWYPIWFNNRSDWTPLTIADHFTGILLYGIKPRLKQ